MTTILAPDLFNVYRLIDIPSNGEFLIGTDLLHLPEKADTISITNLPEVGQVYLGNTLVIENSTTIPLSDITQGSLKLVTAVSDTTILLDFSYQAYDISGTLISLLQVYYPPDIVRDISENIVNGGNFLSGEDGQGYDTDAGDFDSGAIVTNGYSYDGGDFDTGERVGVAPPPISVSNFHLSGTVDPEADNIITLLDENLNPVSTATLPNAEYYDTTVVTPDMSLDLNYTLEFEFAYVTKYFEGFDYGSVPPNSGYDIDYGSVDLANQQDYDFNNIVDYTEPTPVSGVS